MRVRWLETATPMVVDGYRLRTMCISLSLREEWKNEEEDRAGIVNGFGLNQIATSGPDNRTNSGGGFDQSVRTLTRSDGSRVD